VELTVHPLPTAYDPPSGPATVSTPSCCCSSCCCCCLNALAVGVGVTAGVTFQAARNNDRPAALPTLLAILAVPLVILASVALVNGLGNAGGVLAAVVLLYIALVAVALRSAGVPAGPAVLYPLAFAGIVLVLFMVELGMALVTALWIELLAPLSLVGGWALGRVFLRRQAPWPQL
jgi:hypothetical protein